MATENKIKNTATEQSEKTYKYKAPISREEKEPIRVCINGKWYFIQRGIEVEVPESVYEVLMNKERMEQVALQRQIELQEASKF